MLYTMITRTRCTLFIIDDNLPEKLLRIWEHHDIIEKWFNLAQIRRKIEEYKDKISNKSAESW